MHSAAFWYLKVGYVWAVAVFRQLYHVKTAKALDAILYGTVRHSSLGVNLFALMIAIIHSLYSLLFICWPASLAHLGVIGIYLQFRHSSERGP